AETIAGVADGIGRVRHLQTNAGVVENHVAGDKSAFTGDRIGELRDRAAAHQTVVTDADAGEADPAGATLDADPLDSHARSSGPVVVQVHAKDDVANGAVRYGNVLRATLGNNADPAGGAHDGESIEIE